VSILHVELFENRGDESLLAKTDSGTVFLGLDFDDDELACPAGNSDFVPYGDSGLNFDRSFCSILWEHH